MNIFEEAGKRCLRFNGINGVLHVEDLWHMRLDALDQMAVSFKKELDESETESFLDKKAKTKDTDLVIKLEICKSVINTRVEDMDKVEKRNAVKAKNQRIMDLIIKKEDEAFEKTDIEELRSMLESEE